MTLTSRWNEFDPIEIPARNVVCSDCEGNGSVLIAAIREHAYSREEFEESFPEEEDVEAYMRPGSHLHEPCPTCGGLRVVPVPDVSRLTFAQKRIVVMYRREERDHARYEAERAHELKMGY
jgi:hypothetical protein